MDEDYIPAEDRNAADDVRWNKLWNECHDIASGDSSVSEIDLLNTMQQWNLVDPHEAHQKLKGATQPDKTEVSPELPVTEKLEDLGASLSSELARGMHQKLYRTPEKEDSELTTGNLKDKMGEFLKRKIDERG